MNYQVIRSLFSHNIGYMSISWSPRGVREARQHEGLVLRTRKALETRISISRYSLLCGILCLFLSLHMFTSFFCIYTAEMRKFLKIFLSVKIGRTFGSAFLKTTHFVDEQYALRFLG